MKTTAMTVTAAHAGAHVVVKDRTGRVLWSGDLRMTHARKVVGLAPFTVESVEHGEVPKAPKVERPMIVGSARR